MAKKNIYTDGYELKQFAGVLAMTDSVALTEAEQGLFLSFSCSAASKTLTLGLKAGQQMIVANVGASNAVTVKNIAGDTGTSVAAGKVALVIGGTDTADTVKAYVLN